jgi:hypothetical protein
MRLARSRSGDDGPRCGTAFRSVPRSQRWVASAGVWIDDLDVVAEQAKRITHF